LIEADWVPKVLGFWFEELGPDNWFETKEATDQQIRSRFGALYDSLFEAAPSMSFDSTEEALAAIIVFDQFARNMFRGKARAFASDDIAAAIARKAVERGLDQEVAEERRVFFYMPLTCGKPRRPGALRLADVSTAGRYGELCQGASRHHRALRPLPAPEPGARPRKHAGRA
jgi:uncharacterized protein (DUF924 family)